MSQIRYIYRLINLNLLELNNVFTRISDRLDRIEGLRGFPEFYVDTFKFPNQSLTNGNVLKVIDSNEMQISQCNIGDLGGLSQGNFIEGGADGAPIERTPTQVRSDLDLEVGIDVQAWSSILDDLSNLQINGNTLICIYDVNEEIIHQYPLEWTMYASEVFRIIGDELDIRL